jgi:AcrR family transcriptional regulator
VDTSVATPPRLRDRQREQTRRELAVAALALATDQGLASVRVPQIAAAAGVSTRTFNNYFSSKEAAITWPARRWAVRMAEDLLARPADEPLAALEAAIVGRYGAPEQDGLPAGWLRDFRASSPPSRRCAAST